MPIPAGAIASFLIDAAAEVGVEFGKGPLANATATITQAVHQQLGFKISEKTAEFILTVAVAASSTAVGKAVDSVPLEEIGRELRIAMGAGVGKFGEFTNKQLGELAVKSIGRSGTSGRICGQCGKKLPVTAHANRRYCNDGCRRRAACRRRVARESA